MEIIINTHLCQCLSYSPGLLIHFKAGKSFRSFSELLMSPLFKDGQWKAEDDFPGHQRKVFSLLFWKQVWSRWWCFYQPQRCQSGLVGGGIDIDGQIREERSLERKQHLVAEFEMITSSRTCSVSKTNKSGTASTFYADWDWTAVYSHSDVREARCIVTTQ